MKKYLVLMLFAANAAWPATSVDLSVLPQDVERVDIYLLLGQSNMKGRGEIPVTQVENPLIVNMNMEDNQWYVAEHPLHKAGVPDLIDGSDRAGVGPGLDFARGMLSRTNGVRIALVPGAKGGSWINLWMPGMDFYTNAIYRAQKALADAPPGAARIKGVLWLQGESDAPEARYAAYAGKLSTLVQSLRADLNEPELPFIACTIGTFINSPSYPRVEEINYELLSLPQREPHTACVDARDLTGHIGDNMHYNTTSQEIIGARYAAEYAVLTEPSSTNGPKVVFSTDFESATQPGGPGTPVNPAATVAAGFVVSEITSGSGYFNAKLKDDPNTRPGDIHFAGPAGTDYVTTLSQAVLSNRYCQFTITSASSVDFQQLGFSMVGSGSAKNGTVMVRSSLDGFTLNLGTAGGVMNAEHPLNIDLSAVGGFENITSVTFRFYLYDEYSPQNNRFIGIDDIQIETGSSAAVSNAPVRFAPLFSSGAVLQRDQAGSVWGTGQPNEIIKLTVQSQSQVATADSNGVWRVELTPELAAGPLNLTVAATESASTTLTNIYFGDVWLLTGQSNMEQSLATQTGNFPTYYSEMPNDSDDFDDVRFAIIKQLQFTNGPADEVVMDLPWNRWEATRLANMSAAGYFFAREINAALDANGQSDVPLGFIKVCKGATAAEQWVAAELLAAMDEPLIARADKPASSYYNGMIAPMQDFSVKGILWYQGEANADTIDRIEQYPLVFETLVNSWRAQWGNPDLPFYYVQLAPFRAGSVIPVDGDWAWMRGAQTECLSVTNTGMACIIDSGIQGDIHPPFKDRVGNRLARMALDKTYGISTVCRGPVVQSVQINGGEVIVTFDHVAGGLETRAVDSQPDAEEAVAVSISADELGGFALCGSDQVFYWATEAKIISSNQVRIANVVDVPNPVSVRYAWVKYPRCNLFNSAGLPAEPFRTDSHDFNTSTGADASPLNRYLSWAVRHNLSDGADGNDDGDRLSNLAEYALGGNPTNVDAAAVLPIFQTLENHVYYIHKARTDDPSLTYTVQISTNLVSNVWKTNGVEWIGSAGFSNDWKTVTNRVPMFGTPQQFFRLMIEQG